MTAYSPANPWRPFCSERCRLVDLGAWASESYRIPAKPDEEEAPAEGGEPRLQVVGGLGAEVHIALKLRAGLAVGVQDPAGSVEHDDPLAEAVEQGFGEGGEDGRQGSRV